MLSVTRRSAGLLAALTLLLALAGPAAAAEPPTGIVNDGIVTVAFSDEPDQAELVAYETDKADPFYTTGGDADGNVVTFTGVPRPDAGGPTILLAVSGRGLTLVADDFEHGCSTETWTAGETAGLVASTTVEATVEMTDHSTTTCYDVRGTIVDAAGNPLDALVSVSLEYIPDGPALGFPTFAAADGSYMLRMSPEYVGAPAEITVAVTGVEIRSEPFGDGCFRQVGQQGAATAERQAAADGTLEPIDIVTSDVILGEDCGTVGSPTTPTPSGAAPTLPPTDVARDAGPSRPTGLLAGLLMVVSTILLVATHRRTVRR